ncbi:hypothetical protein Ae201684_002245 [Aphanomyces euteiches]|uniref:Uncharacterized protein n=1 Tax=Aphanomyces euteiches TaxID=100861 RepID=A0A6G0XQX4_9STRA|nr:hypothetical protein Ae201684_002245 [Aphanomyces euteiches]
MQVAAGIHWTWKLSNATIELDPKITDRNGNRHVATTQIQQGARNAKPRTQWSIAGRACCTSQAHTTSRCGLQALRSSLTIAATQQSAQLVLYSSFHHMCALSDEHQSHTQLFINAPSTKCLGGPSDSSTKKSTAPVSGYCNKETSGTFPCIPANFRLVICTSHVCYTCGIDCRAHRQSVPQKKVAFGITNVYI